MGQVRSGLVFLEQKFHLKRVILRLSAADAGCSSPDSHRLTINRKTSPVLWLIHKMHQNGTYQINLRCKLLRFVSAAFNDAVKDYLMEFSAMLLEKATSFAKQRHDH